MARTLDWGTDETTGQPFIVMELLEGEDLSVALKRVQCCRRTWRCASRPRPARGFCKRTWRG